MVNLFYGLPEELQHKINWMNIHSDIKTLVSQRQSDVVFRDGTTHTTYVHDPAQNDKNPLASAWQAIGCTDPDFINEMNQEWPTWLELEYFLSGIEHMKLNDPLAYEQYVDVKNYWEPQWA